MPIFLPTTPAPANAVPCIRDFGGVLTPFLGGPEQRINRLGTRWGVRVTMPPMRSETDGRLFISRLVQARSDRLVMLFPGLDFDTGNPGAPLVGAAVAGGSMLPIKGMIPGYQVREGQFFSVIHGGRRYLHMFGAAGTANGAGVISSIAIWPMLRTNLSADDVVEIAQPMIEGHVLPGDELSWEMALARRINLSFSVQEAA